MQEYISIVFRGGPANRFFQYHTATFLAYKWSKKFIYDPNQTMKAGMHHDPEFLITDFFPCETKRIANYNVVIRQFDKEEKLNPLWKDELLTMDIPVGNILLKDGWYQTFWDNHFTCPILPATDILFDSDNSYFIHVRRGDYLGSILDLDLEHYYRKGYEKMEQLHKNATCVICSDDITWCEDNLNYINRPFFIKDKNYKETLYIMSQCRLGSVLSNSTFSLWGAYLARLNGNNNSKYLSYLPSPFIKSGYGKSNGLENYIYPNWSEKIFIQ